MTSCFFCAMADPADRLIAAATNANSALFICPSHDVAADVYSPALPKLSLRLHEGKKTA